MNKLDLSQLLKTAQAATQDWKDADDWYHDHAFGCTLPSEDAAYIGAFAPQTAETLIVALREALTVIKPFGGRDGHEHVNALLAKLREMGVEA
jgi:hypothetical protein